MGEQTLSGMNIRLTQQRDQIYPIHGFSQIASRRDRNVGPKRWRYMGLLEYLRHYSDTQVDSRGEMRRVWLFEFRVHAEPGTIPIEFDARLAEELLTASRLAAREIPEDNEIVQEVKEERAATMEELEVIRRTMLGLAPRQFELFLGDLLQHCGYDDVCVTRYSADGGIDVNATVGSRIWVFERTLVQVQAKRWLHSVGRKEVAELRGSLKPFARGVILTTGHFSRAAVNEASEEGKNPIGLVDGIKLSRVVLESKFGFSV